MSKAAEVLITFSGGRQVDATVGRHTIHTDQPVENGGRDTAPAPFDVFLASLGACAGLYVQGFCASRGIPLDGMRLVERLAYHPDGTLSAIDMEIQLPDDFPERYRDAVVRAVEQCAVKRAIAAHPAFQVRTTKAVEAQDAVSSAAALI